MTAALRPSRTHTDAADAEASTGLKHERVDGELFAIAGGAPEHNDLSANVLGLLHAQLRGRTCRVVGGDQKVHIHTDSDDAGVYPDVAVYCGPRERSAAVPTALTNPSVVIEVLSQSTELYDRSRKFALYRQLPSLQHYVLLSQDRPHLEVFDRNADGTWTLRFAGPGEALDLATIGANLNVNDLYEGVFEE